MSTIRLTEQAAPGTPGANSCVLYFKADGLMYWKDDAGVEYAVSFSGGGGTFTNLTVTGNTILGDAAGDTLTVNAGAWTLGNPVTVTGTWANLGTVTTVDINGGTIDGTAIGGSTPAAGAFTTLNSSGNAVLGGSTMRLQADTGRYNSDGLRFFQTATNIAGVITLMPNGANTTTEVRLYNTSDPANTGSVSFRQIGTVVDFGIGLSFGTGTGPSTFNVAGGTITEINCVTNGGTQARVLNTAGANRFITLTGSNGGNPTIGTSAGGIDINPGGALTLRANAVASAVNYLEVIPTAAAGAAVVVRASGADTNITCFHDAQGTGSHIFRTGAGARQQARITDSGDGSLQLDVFGANAGGAPGIRASGATNASVLVAAAGTGSIFLNTGGGNQAQVINIASAVNYLQIAGGATGVSPTLTAAGTDTNIGLAVVTKGTSAFSVNTGGGAATQLAVTHTASANRFVTITGSNGAAPTIGTSAGDLYLNPASGSVGIGTPTPGARLHVSGGNFRLQAAIDGSNGILQVYDTAGTAQISLYATPSTCWFGTVSNNALAFTTNNIERVRLDTSGNFIVNTAAIATTATNGFLYVPSCAGTPTGTPTAYTGRVPIVVDSTNNKLYFYSGGAWRDAGP